MAGAFPSTTIQMYIDQPLWRTAIQSRLTTALADTAEIDIRVALSKVLLETENHAFSAKATASPIALTGQRAAAHRGAGASTPLASPFPLACPLLLPTRLPSSGRALVRAEPVGQAMGQQIVTLPITR